MKWLVDRARLIGRLTALSFWRGLTEFYNSDDLTHAAAIAYYGLLSLFPFVLVLLAVLGSAAADDTARGAVLRFMLRYFPTQFDFMTLQLDAFRQSGVQIGILSSIALVWAALGVFGAVTSAVNHAWGVEKQHSFWKHKLVSFVMLASAGGMLFIALMMVSAVEIVRATWFARVIARNPGLLFMESLGFRFGATVLLILVLGLIYYFVPNAKVRFRDVWVGAVMTGLLWRGALEGFSWYVRDMTRFNVVHGSIAAVVVFLFWVYISAVILLYGVEFTAAYGRLLRRRPPEIPAAPAPRV